MLISKLRIAAIAALALLSHAPRADEIVTPNALAGLDGSGGLSTPLTTAPRTIQWVIARSQLAAIPVGSVISGMAYRVDAGSAAWPTTAATFNQYDVSIGSALYPPASASLTFAANAGPDTVLARSGPITFLPGLIPGGSTPPFPNSFGIYISFNNRYVYTGGDLCITLRHSGGPATACFTDAITTSDAQSINVMALADFSSATGSVGAKTNAPVLRLRYAPPDNYSRAYPPLDQLDGDDTLLATAFQTAARTTQVVYDAAELVHIPKGSLIRGLGFRLDAGSVSGPASPLTTSNFQVELARSPLSPDAMSFTVANNEVASDRTVVRTGALTIPANALLDTGTAPKAYTFKVLFDKPYEYRGGHLSVVIRHNGFPSTIAIGANSVSLISGARAGFQTGFSATTHAIINANVPSLELIFDAATQSPSNWVTEEPNAALPVFGTSGGVIQLAIAPDELLAARPGSIIQGLTFRQADGALGINAFPNSADLLFSRFDVTVQQSTRSPGSLSTNFATNAGPGAVLVRSGPFVMSRQWFPGGSAEGTPQRFGRNIPFDRPYSYPGGTLLVTIRYALSNPATMQADAVAKDTPGGGWGSRIAAITNTTNPDATSGSRTNVPVTKLFFTPVLDMTSTLATTQGNGGLSTLTQSEGRTYQSVLSDQVFESIPFNATFSGLLFRAYANEAAWPLNDANFSLYAVEMGVAATSPAGMSSVFDNNVGGLSVLTRVGPLSVDAARVRAESPLSPPSFFVDFNRPWQNYGKGVYFTVRHSGSGTTPVFLDTVFDAFGLGSLFQGWYAGGFGATVGTAANSVPIPRFVYLVRPCAGDLTYDGYVDDNDFSQFVTAYDFLLTPLGDLNGDLVTDDADFSIFVQNYDFLFCP
ncbi:MAG: hypothetical protein K2Y21_01560 [Phycisphaerales bacterium]|nr:hypothetical protein [Phycisphaerales bacterium]